jgi:DNA-binding response OmpR family regulator
MVYALFSMTTSDKSYRPSIWVVDDETVIADTIAQILTHEGYAASVAYDGESAFQAALLTPPQLVISDVILPGSNGVDLGITIRRIFPDCTVILSSGEAASSAPITAAQSAGNHFVFRKDALYARAEIHGPS